MLRANSALESEWLRTVLRQKSKDNILAAGHVSRNESGVELFDGTRFVKAKKTIDGKGLLRNGTSMRKGLAELRRFQLRNCVLAIIDDTLYGEFACLELALVQKV